MPVDNPRLLYPRIGSDSGVVLEDEAGAAALTTSTTGARGRLLDMGGAAVNVRAFGAVGDGVTDDYPAFAAAYAALGVGGGAITVPAGTYRLSQRLIYNAPVVLQGAGSTINTIAGTVLSFPAGVGGIYLNGGAAGSSVRGLTLLGTRGGAAAVGLQVRAHGCLIENLLVDSFQATGVLVDTTVGTVGGNANNCTYINVRVAGVGGDGFKFLGGDSNAQVCINCDASTVGGFGFLNLGSCNFFQMCHVNTTGDAAFLEAGNGSMHLLCYVEGGGYFDIAGTHGIIIANSSFGRPTFRWVTPASKSSMTLIEGGAGFFRQRISDPSVPGSHLYEWFIEGELLRLQDTTRGKVVCTLDLTDPLAAGQFWEWGVHQKLADGVNLYVGTSIGTRIGQSAFAKLGFFGAPPVTRPGAIADADGSLPSITARFNELKAAIGLLGLIQPGNP